MRGWGTGIVGSVVWLGSIGGLPAAAKVDSAAYDRLLHAHVKDGVVDYGALAAPANRQALQAYIVAIAAAKPEAEGGRNARLAAWLNAYNAIVLESVLLGNSPATFFGRYRFFKADTYAVFGRHLTLDQVENQIIRPMFAEPRVHFALVCASKSCPPLRSEAYGGSTLDTQLDDQGRAFLASEMKNHFDPATKTLALSSIFKWYAADFAAAAQNTPRFIAKFVPGSAASWITGSDVKIEFLDYDWSLNGRK